MTQEVFFSFCYQDMSKSHLDSDEYSICEESHLEFDSETKKMIDKQIEKTSITAVILGSQSCNNRRVRYEIMKSIELGKEILGLRINNKSPNPLDYLAVRYSEDGNQVDLFALTNRIWRKYQDLECYKVYNIKKEYWGKFLIVSEIYKFSD